MKAIIDGEEYPFDLEPTYREDRVMKAVSGLTAGQRIRGLGTGDNDANLAFAALALHRAKGLTADEIESYLLDKKVADITLDFSEPADPPAEPPQAANEPGEESAPSD
jgi:hypothetical protein